MYLIKQDLNKCVGCGSCVAVCPDNWEMTDSKPKPKKTKVKEKGCNEKAVEACPVGCITIEEINE